MFSELCAKWIRIDTINFEIMVFILTFLFRTVTHTVDAAILFPILLI